MDVNTVKALIEKSKKRKFVQTVELIVNLRKEYDINRNKLLEYLELPHGRGKKVKIACIVNNDYGKIAKEVFDLGLTVDELKELEGKKRELKKIARRYYIFVAQASTMTLVGKILGKYLSVRDKMPSPRHGMILPDIIDKDTLINVYNKMQKYVRISIRKSKTIGIPVGTEDMKPEEIFNNINTALKFLQEKIPGGKQSIKSIYLKLTMSKSIRIW